MSEKIPTPIPAYPSHLRRRPLWRTLLAAFLAILILGAAELYSGGYAVLIGGGDESAGGDSKITVRRCTYFTGTAKIITHIYRSASDPRGKAKCSLTMKRDLGPMSGSSQN